jgi:FkbM family methyltransferase
MFDENIGQLNVVNGRQIVTTFKDKSGIAVWGPYAQLQPGRYVAECVLGADSCDTVSGLAEVIANGILHCTVYIYPSRLNSGENKIYLPFNLNEPAIIEVRFHSYGRAALHIDLERKFLRLSDDEPNFSPMLPPGAPSPDAFFQEHIGRVLDLHQAGAVLTISDNGTVVRFGEVAFFLKNTEDFQVADEVFLVNEYTTKTMTPKIIIDVGMNIGLASLKMATDPMVLEVYGYEPFRTPFNRAMDHFKLNPSLSRKIHPHQFGLAGADQDSDVVIAANATLSNSIKGREGGTEIERITVRDAGPILRPILDKADNVGAEVFVKLDCEGSEFPILESLVRNDLLKRIRGFMVEWHKWWSADKTMATLAEPLLRSGFVVFDRTNPVDRWAGHFYAVRIDAPK